MLVQTAAHRTFLLRMRPSVASARSTTRTQLISTCSPDQTTAAFHGTKVGHLFSSVFQAHSVTWDLGGKERRITWMAYSSD